MIDRKTPPEGEPWPPRTPGRTLGFYHTDREKAKNSILTSEIVKLRVRLPLLIYQTIQIFTTSHGLRIATSLNFFLLKIHFGVELDRICCYKRNK
jgi:hypothetical protein